MQSTSITSWLCDLGQHLLAEASSKVLLFTPTLGITISPCWQSRMESVASPQPAEQVIKSTQATLVWCLGSSEDWWLSRTELRRPFLHFHFFPWVYPLERMELWEASKKAVSEGHRKTHGKLGWQARFRDSAKRAFINESQLRGMALALRGHWWDSHAPVVSPTPTHMWATLTELTGLLKNKRHEIGWEHEGCNVGSGRSWRRKMWRRWDHVSLCTCMERSRIKERKS